MYIGVFVNVCNIVLDLDGVSCICYIMLFYELHSCVCVGGDVSSIFCLFFVKDCS